MLNKVLCFSCFDNHLHVNDVCVFLPHLSRHRVKENQRIGSIINSQLGATGQFFLVGKTGKRRWAPHYLYVKGYFVSLLSDTEEKIGALL